MKLNLPILTVVFWAIAMTAMGTAQSPTSPKSAPAGEGDRLVAMAGRQMLALPSLSATVRQHIQLFDREINGSGKYLQLGNNSGMMRLDMKFMEGKHLVANVTQTFQKQEVKNEPGDPETPSQKEVFYTNIRHPWQASVTIVDLGRVREAIGPEGQIPWSVSTAKGMAPGGLSSLLLGLAKDFQFQSPQAKTYRRVPVWIVRGTWKPEKLAKLLPNQKKDILAGKQAQLDQLPPHLPASVVLTLGRDSFFNLFPYRIEYFRVASNQGTAKSADSTATSQPVVTIEFSQVQQRPDLRSEDCEYNPGGQIVTDITEQYIQRMGF